MKHLLVIILASVSLFAHAQFELNKKDQLLLGPGTVDDNKVTTMLDTITKLKVRGQFGDLGCGGRIAFGDAVSLWYMNVMVGEAGTTDTDIIWLHGKHGACLTSGPVAHDTIFVYDDNRSTNIDFRRTLSAPSYLTKAIQKKTTTARSAVSSSAPDNVLDGIDKLTMFVASQPSAAPAAAPKRSVAASTGASDKDAADAIFYAALEKELATCRDVFALDPEEMKDAFPSLVATDKSGDLYIDYVGMVPVLVEAVKNLRAELAELRAEAGLEPMRARFASAGIEDLDTAEAFVGQNVPNPCSMVSSIEYKLPEHTKEATLYVYNLQGLQVRSYQLDAGRFEGAIDIAASDYEAGMYIYALVADGVEIGTRRMIINR